MAITRKDVEHIAKLARLELGKEEIDLFQTQLSAILDYAAHLQQVDTAGIPPTSSVLPMRSPLRVDEAKSGLSVTALMQNAPEEEQNQFRVPIVLE